MSGFLHLQEVSFTAQNQSVVESLTHDFEEGKSTALIGPSGSGKSTMLKLSAGLIIPSAGCVTLRGRALSDMSREENLAFRREAAFVFQDSALWANQSIRQTMELPLKLHFPLQQKGERDRKINEAMQLVGYRKALDIRPSMLSMGEQKLIAFARALVCGPRILFLDEWTESLDEAAARRLVALVKERRMLGQTIIFVSHDFRLVRDLADKIVMLVGGRIHLRLTREQLDADRTLEEQVEKGITA